ncbi:hypothetical protein [Gemmatimonas sp.]|uniref:hypothetical protein n=1 Tax=Gemmatimonas sp. TaxID=1962908 RepID=UPI00286E4FEA|nr:hypothetical protein [Gemmatimonas sp.]
MSSDRRIFLKTAGLSAAALAAASSVLHADAPTSLPLNTVAEELESWEQARAETWDTSWTKRVTGKHKAMFDVPEIRDGVGIFRAGIWGRQYTEVLKLAPGDLSTVIVIRHAAIPLAMNSEFWATYGVGKELKVKDEKGKKWAMSNPMLSNASTDMQNSFSALLLDKQMANGAIVLGCGMAFNQIVSTVAKQDKLNPTDARDKAKSFLIPGVILQPSGIFANVMAEEAGCAFVNAV